MISACFLGAVLTATLIVGVQAGALGRILTPRLRPRAYALRVPMSGLWWTRRGQRPTEERFRMHGTEGGGDRRDFGLATDRATVCGHPVKYSGIMTEAPA